MVGFVGVWGSWILRGTIGFAAIFSTFAWLRNRAPLAAALFAARAGAAVLRVHDVRATRQAIDLDRALTSVARSEKAGVR